MIDISKWQEPIDYSNKLTDDAFTLIKLLYFHENFLHINTEGLNPDAIIYYKYDFKNGKDIMLSERDE